MTTHKARSVLLICYACLEEIKLLGCDGQCGECVYCHGIDETMAAYATAIKVLGEQPPANIEEAATIELEKKISERMEHDLLFGDSDPE